MLRYRNLKLELPFRKKSTIKAFLFISGQNRRTCRYKYVFTNFGLSAYNGKKISAQLEIYNGVIPCAYHLLTFSSVTGYRYITHLYCLAVQSGLYVFASHAENRGFDPRPGQV